MRIKYALLIVFVSLQHWVVAQDSLKSAMLELSSVEPYKIEVSFDKTTHLLFPAAIRYVDIGGESIIGQTAEDASNVLRLKAGVRGFDETNVAVITTDGRYYSFDVRFNPAPMVTSYDLVTMGISDGRARGNVLFRELGDDSPEVARLLLASIFNRNKRVLRHLGARAYGISFQLMGIYVHNGKYYFHTEIKNRSNVPFGIDYIIFKIVDKKIAKRTVVQENVMTPLRTYKPLSTIADRASDCNVFLLDQFTIGEDKLLEIEVFEKNGSRHLVLEVENADLIRARVINKLHLKF